MVSRLWFFCLFFFPLAHAQTYNFNFTKLEPWYSWMEHKITDSGVRFVLPGTADVNHVDGIGTIYLLAHLPIGAPGIPGAPGFLDLRNANIELTIRGTDLNLHHGKLAWWIVSNLPTKKTSPYFTYQQTNWAYIGETFNEADVTNHSWFDWRWPKVSVVLNPSPMNWKYAGTNTSIKGSWGNRYVHYPIGKALGHVDATLHLVILGAKKPPEGILEIANIKIHTLDTTLSPQLPAFSDLKKLVVAKKWIEAAPGLKLLADSGHSGAAFHYANILNYGLTGKPVDICAARAYYEAAEYDEAGAAVELATQDITAICNPRNYQSALQRLDRGKEIPRARYYKAMILLYHFPEKVNMQEVIDDLTYAANGDYVDAMGELGLIYARNGDKENALHWFSMAERRALASDPRKKDFFGASIKTLQKEIP